ncbi:hypothetical protein BJ165DRAFT_1530096 [Panaeolus papilionaceus]|nr:hypothetical protein BJ165DRAFT_1530096 [Panaeolus papilionaceus]
MLFNNYPNPFHIAARAMFQKMFLEEAARYALAVTNLRIDGDSRVDYGVFIDLVWDVYRDRWRGPYGQDEVCCKENLTDCLTCFSLELDVPDEELHLYQDWRTRYEVFQDRMLREEIQEELNLQVPRVCPFDSPFYTGTRCENVDAKKAEVGTQ